MFLPRDYRGTTEDQLPFRTHDQRTYTRVLDAAISAGKQSGACTRPDWPSEARVKLYKALFWWSSLYLPDWWDAMLGNAISSHPNAGSQPMEGGHTGMALLHPHVYT